MQFNKEVFCKLATCVATGSLVKAQMMTDCVKPTKGVDDGYKYENSLSSMSSNKVSRRGYAYACRSADVVFPPAKLQPAMGIAP